MDDAKHRREEQERRDKRKAAKSQKSESQREKERKRKEHAQKILQKHGGDTTSKRHKSSDKKGAVDNKSPFQDLFKRRAQGFEIDFQFRNAPPRPPVGPCFVGSNGLEGVLMDLAQYKAMNAVEWNHSWKLHCEPDVGVPLAPSAMDPLSYTTAPKSAAETEGMMHPADEKLLNWEGSMGDTAADELKQRQDHSRALARLALSGRKSSSSAALRKIKQSPRGAGGATPASMTSPNGRKKFSRVLDENMQSWMKKTTYLSNDYSRKVHDFKSLAKTKAEVAADLDVQQRHLGQHRKASAISKTFDEAKQKVTKHPSKSHLKPVMEMPFLPNVEQWGNAYTHVVMDKTPGELDKLDQSFVANVQRKDVNSKMTCQLFVPATTKPTEESAAATETSFQAIQQYELDVLPLKEGDDPHDNFCIWIDSTTSTATYLPISSRVQLSTGRPLKKKKFNMKVARRPIQENDTAEKEERMAEIDVDMETKVTERQQATKPAAAVAAPTTRMEVDYSDDDDSDKGESFMATTKTIVAEG